MKLPKGAITIDNRYGRRYPIDQGYYGFIVSEYFGGHIYDERQYTIDIFNDGEYITTFTAPHGEW
jgi:hypothetical protein